MRFKTKLHQSTDINATGIVVPAKIVEALGAGKTPPINVAINGRYAFSGRVAVYGGDFLIGVAKEHRKKAGIKGGDNIEVEIKLDDVPREVTIAPNFSKRSQRRGARKPHSASSPTPRARRPCAKSRARRLKRRARGASPRSSTASAKRQSLFVRHPRERGKSDCRARTQRCLQWRALACATSPCRKR